MRDPLDPNSYGVQTKQPSGTVDYHAKLTISCDGIYSKFRKELSPTNVPTIGSYFIGLYLKNAELPAKGKGHVLWEDMHSIDIFSVPN